MTSCRADVCQIPGQQIYGDSIFPYVYAAKEGFHSVADAANWVADRRSQLLSEAHKHGAILFRDFPLALPEDFDSFVAALGIENFPYKRSLSNAVRVNFTERVFSANEAPAAVKIFLHHEMAQTPLYPSFCMSEFAQSVPNSSPSSKAAASNIPTSCQAMMILTQVWDVVGRVP
jgi:hypothetical protein